MKPTHQVCEPDGFYFSGSTALISCRPKLPSTRSELIATRPKLFATCPKLISTAMSEICSAAEQQLQIVCCLERHCKFDSTVQTCITDNRVRLNL
jgi:hypothetical protein